MLITLKKTLKNDIFEKIVLPSLRLFNQFKLRTITVTNVKMTQVA